MVATCGKAEFANFCAGETTSPVHGMLHYVLEVCCGILKWANITHCLAIGRNGSNVKYIEWPLQNPCVAAQLVPTAQSDLPPDTHI